MLVGYQCHCSDMYIYPTQCIGSVFGALCDFLFVYEIYRDLHQTHREDVFDPSLGRVWRWRSISAARMRVMLRKIYFFSLVSVSLLTVFSCKTWVSWFPSSSVQEENLWVSGTGFFYRLDAFPVIQKKQCQSTEGILTLRSKRRNAERNSAWIMTKIM